MLPRALTFVLLGSLVLPAFARAQDREWEEDYSQEWRDDGQPPPAGDGYDVSVDLNDTSAQVNLNTFQSTLSPYGDWVTVAGYGQVWRPRVAAGWRPYYYGRWEWTNEGWLWVSDEPFGWAAYHYGRWTYDGYYGWVWVPGNQWAPAWVTWRYSGDVVGWAPLGPGVSVYVNSYPFVDTWWTFVPCDHFVAYPVYSYAYAPNYGRRWFYATAPAPPMGRPGPGRPMPGRRAVAAPAWGGPPPRAIEQRIGRPITPVRVVSAPNPGAARAVRPGEVAIYRPERALPRGGEGRPAAGPAPRGYQEQGGRSPYPAPRAGLGGTPAPAQRGGGEAPPVYRPVPRMNEQAPGYAPPAYAPRGGNGGGAPPAYAPRGGGNGGGAPPGYTAPAPRGGGTGNGAPPAYTAPRGGGNGGGAPPAYTAPAPRGGGNAGGGGGRPAPAPSGGNRGHERHGRG